MRIPNKGIQLVAIFEVHFIPLPIYISQISELCINHIIKDDLITTSYDIWLENVNEDLRHPFQILKATQSFEIKTCTLNISHCA